MNRPFLFLSGEAYTTLTLAFSKEKWQHTMSSSKLVETGHFIKRHNFNNEVIKGVIFYADMDNKELELENLNIIKQKNIPCFPSPYILSNMIDRHYVLQQCCKAGFVNHDVTQIYYKDNLKFDYPVVLKTGNSHRGHDKYLIINNEFPKWDGIATIEPYFNGESVRILIIGDKIFGLKLENYESWIKNAAGAEVYPFNPSENLINHAKAVANFWGLEIAGVDYILEDNGSFHFLEINQFPGIAATDEIVESAKKFLSKIMDDIEHIANKKD
jgi:glutathione synthase/RimK-type ligase-like ATP-grasp enzyme